MATAKQNIKLHITRTVVLEFGTKIREDIFVVYYEMGQPSQGGPTLPYAKKWFRTCFNRISLPNDFHFAAQVGLVSKELPSTGTPRGPDG